MSKPVEHYGRWRVRWTDANGIRRSETHPTFEDADVALRRHELECLEIKQGLADASAGEPNV